LVEKLIVGRGISKTTDKEEGRTERAPRRSSPKHNPSKKSFSQRGKL